MTDGPEQTRSFFVDEAGDLTLFNKRRAVVVGHPGVSRTFMVGVLHLPNPRQAYTKLENLRSTLMADPYFRGVPSMSANQGKTARFFHAKDDIAEVRREVFRILPELGGKVQVAIRRKERLVAEARRLFQSVGRKLTEADVYDDLVKRLFKNLLHKADRNQIIFSRRGKSARYEALQNAIAKAKCNFEKKWKIPSDRPTDITSAHPSNHAGLQIVDYYLWAIQRLYERGEERFFKSMAGSYRLIMDLDDTRNKNYGEWYSDSNPLELQKIKPVAS